MGLIQRVSDLLKANINQMLDNVEDPEAILGQLIQEMQESYRRSKIEVARALSDEKRLRHLMETNQETAFKWGRKAVLAVEKQDDDLAREALRRKRSYEDIAHEFQVQWEEQKQMTDMLRDNLFALEAKIDEARRKKSLLIARQKRAEAHKKLKSALEQPSSEQTYWALGRFEEKFTEVEALAEAEIELLDDGFEGRFRELERGGLVEDELEALKLEVHGKVPSDDSKLLAAQASVVAPEKKNAVEAVGKSEADTGAEKSADLATSAQEPSAPGGDLPDVALSAARPPPESADPPEAAVTTDTEGMHEPASGARIIPSEAVEPSGAASSSDADAKKRAASDDVDEPSPFGEGILGL